MRSPRNRARITTARKNSLTKPKNLILQSSTRREFFRFGEGVLVEYDLTKFKSKQVTLSHEDKEGLRAFGFMD